MKVNIHRKAVPIRQGDEKVIRIVEAHLRRSSPALPVDDLWSRAPASFYWRAGEQLWIGGIAEGQGYADVQVIREGEQLAGSVMIVDRRQTGANAKLPGSQLHVSGCLTGVEHHAEAGIRVGGEDSDPQGGSSQVPGPIAERSEERRVGKEGRARWAPC